MDIPFIAWKKEGMERAKDQHFCIGKFHQNSEISFQKTIEMILKGFHPMVLFWQIFTPQQQEKGVVWLIQTFFWGKKWHQFIIFQGKFV